MKMIVGLFENISEAERVVDDLTDAGVAVGNINLLAGDAEARYAGQIYQKPYDEADASVDGAVAGGVLGGLTGALVGLGAFAIPGLGPVILAGPLASALIGAGIGAASGGLLAALVEWGISEEEAEFYLEGVRRGGVLVAVRADEEEVDSIVAVMGRHGPIDLEERAAAWREEGWVGYDAGAAEDVVFDRLDNAYREHYERFYAHTPVPYTSYTPAYRLGRQLSLDDSLSDAAWEGVEPEARRRWQEDYDEPWEDYQEAVAHGWRTSRPFG